MTLATTRRARHTPRMNIDPSALLAQFTADQLDELHRLRRGSYRHVKDYIVLILRLPAGSNRAAIARSICDHLDQTAPAETIEQTGRAHPRPLEAGYVLTFDPATGDRRIFHATAGMGKWSVRIFDAADFLPPGPYHLTTTGHQLADFRAVVGIDPGSVTTCLRRAGKWFDGLPDAWKNLHLPEKTGKIFRKED
jgi:hypothetical protein